MTGDVPSGVTNSASVLAATIQHNPGAQRVISRTKQCKPLNNVATTVGKVQAVQYWLSPTNGHADRKATATCLENGLDMTPGQISSFESCGIAAMVTDAHPHGLTLLVNTDLPKCYLTAVGAMPSSDMSSGSARSPGATAPATAKASP